MKMIMNCSKEMFGIYALDDKKSTDTREDQKITIMSTVNSQYCDINYSTVNRLQSIQIYNR